MIPELLMPAGDLEKAKYAIAFGADAVYAGIPQFSLRVKENTFNLNETKELIDYVHKKNKKIYITANIYPHNNKIESFQKHFDELVKLKPDAFIMSDPGLIMLALEKYPEIEIHLSVQQNNVNWASSKFWGKIGIKRIILARELSIKEIETIIEKNPNLEFEVFIHGAMCIAYSGRCLLSNYFAKRDANQGICAQSCRWQYKVLKQVGSEQETDLQSDFTIRSKPEDYKKINGDFFLEEKLRPNQLTEIQEDENGTYIMNSRDICAISYIEDLMKIGVHSFKVEGRNKSVYYAAIVAKVYREIIDKLKAGEKIDAKKYLEELQSVANRGYIPGFLAEPLTHEAQWYEKNSHLQTHIFAGILISYNKETGEAIFHAKNQLNSEDIIEIITPKNKFEVSLKEMTDENNNKISEIHPGAGNFKIIIPNLNSDFAIARLKGNQKRNS
ncbi:MAG: U32 family peptidase C-terminal domain-containing protein [Candidatus Woesearchaeota archaeon]